ncbi:MAG: hypothetical protein HYZ72_14935, partial [Deltaproteobacteria bacterium]|nr:hypothetical protein [Deltaproteobacteria bacterium]
PEHLAWDLSGPTFTALTGKPATPDTNPCGRNDPVVGLGNVTSGPGGISAATPAAAERSIMVPIRAKRIQVSGASLSFPVNALTSMFVGSDNPLYYIYTTFRSEVAYFRNVGFRTDFHDGQAGTAFQRFLSVPLSRAGVTSSPFLNKEFLPGGAFSSEGTCRREDGPGVRGCRRGREKSADAWAFNIGLDHNQWIRFLNPANSFVFSAQLFDVHVMNMSNTFRSDRPAGLLNDRFAIGVRPRKAAPTGPTTNPAKLRRPPGEANPLTAPQGSNTGNRTQGCITPLIDPANPAAGRKPNPPCIFKGLQGLAQDTELFTLSISTQYMAGNLKPSVVFFYDWSGSYLFQPGIDWTFYDPFRLSIRYNFIEGRYAGIGLFKTKDNAWIELQYLLY